MMVMESGLNFLGNILLLLKMLRAKNVTFPVVIATGVNETTEKAYHDKNRLVVLGFAPSGVEYASPETLLAKRMGIISRRS